MRLEVKFLHDSMQLLIEKHSDKKLKAATMCVFAIIKELIEMFDKRLYLSPHKNEFNINLELSQALAIVAFFAEETPTDNIEFTILKYIIELIEVQVKQIVKYE